MADPYAPSAPLQDEEDENASFINQSSYIVPMQSAYDDNVHQSLKQNAFDSAPDPAIASSAAGDWNQFEQLQSQQKQTKISANTSQSDIVIDPLQDDEGFGHSTYGQRMDYTEPIYHDKPFLFLWIAHFIVMFIVLIYEWSDTKVAVKEANAGFFIVFICAVIGAILGYLWTKIIRKYAGGIIKMMLWGNLVFLLVGAFINFLLFHMLNCILFVVFAFIFGIYMWSIWKRIPFTSTLIEISCSILNMYESTIVIALGILILQILWILMWSAITVAYMSPKNENFNEFVVFLLLISFYWNLEVFKNISHTTVCGVAASWYFSSFPHAPTKDSLKRSCTTSLGSIALGSLIVAIITALRYIVRTILSKTKHNIVRCLLDCFLSCLQRMIAYFNMYAFCHVAIYGTSYIESSKATWQLLQSKGILALINDDLTGFVILCGALIGGIICAIVGGIMSFGTDAPETYAFFGFLVGFYLCLTVLNVVTSCVITMFVCYAEDPHALNMNHPQEYNKIENARKNLGHVRIEDEPSM